MVLLLGGVSATAEAAAEGYGCNGSNTVLDREFSKILPLGAGAVET